jgi:uncharacterized repeat protein (TIGR01451 family)
MKKKNVLSLVAAFYLFAAIFGVGMTANAATTARMQHDLNVANATRGDASYAKSTSALVDQVVKYQIYYHNNEASDSGITANDLNIKINIPNTLGTSHVATSSVTGSNTNALTSSATVTTQVPTRLVYIPGTAYRRHNIGTNAKPNWVDQPISDSVVTSGYSVPKMNPCWNFEESIYVQARVNASYLSIDKTAKIQGGPSWIKDVSAQPGNTIDYMINIKNEGNTVIHNVVVVDAVPAGLTYVAGSAKLINGNNPNGVTISDSLVTTGVNIANYNPGSNALVRYSVTVPAEYNPCGNVVFTNVAKAASSETSDISSSAIVRAGYACPVPTPTPTPTPNVVVTGKGNPLPTSGPAEAAAGAAGLSITGGAAYAWMRSKKALASALTKIK